VGWPPNFHSSVRSEFKAKHEAIDPRIPPRWTRSIGTDASVTRRSNSAAVPGSSRYERISTNRLVLRPPDDPTTVVHPGGEEVVAPQGGKRPHRAVLPHEPETGVACRGGKRNEQLHLSPNGSISAVSATPAITPLLLFRVSWSSLLDTETEDTGGQGQIHIQIRNLRTSTRHRLAVSGQKSAEARLRMRSEPRRHS